MKNLKISKRLIISCITTTCMFAFILVSCETEEVEPQSITKEAIDLSKKGNRPDRIDICHYDEDTGGWMQLTVSEKSWEDHSLHGDQWLDLDDDGFTAANECGIGSMDDCDDTDANANPDSGCEPKIFAIAYINLNGEPGFQKSPDLLISKLVDYNNDGVISAGDKIITDVYPVSLDPVQNLGVFAITEHILDSNFALNRINSFLVDLSIGNDFFIWFKNSTSEGYYEGNLNSYSRITDDRFYPAYDEIRVVRSSPSLPSYQISVSDSDSPGVDNNFIDVDIFVD